MKHSVTVMAVASAAATLVLSGCVTTGPRPGHHPQPPQPEPPPLQYKTLRSTDNHQCLDVAGNASQNGSPAQMRRCDGSKSQRWAVEGRRIINAWGLCLDAHGPSMHQNGGKVQVWRCNDKHNQLWTYERNTRLRNGGGKCLDMDKPAISLNKPSGKVHIWECHGRNNQKWYFR
jgi:hypothetical protein